MQAVSVLGGLAEAKVTTQGSDDTFCRSRRIMGYKTTSVLDKDRKGLRACQEREKERER